MYELQFQIEKLLPYGITQINKIVNHKMNKLEEYLENNMLTLQNFQKHNNKLSEILSAINSSYNDRQKIIIQLISTIENQFKNN